MSRGDISDFLGGPAPRFLNNAIGRWEKARQGVNLDHQNRLLERAHWLSAQLVPGDRRLFWDKAFVDLGLERPTRNAARPDVH